MNSTNVSDTVIIKLSSLIPNRLHYCYIIIASNGTHTVRLEGTFSTGMPLNYIMGCFIITTTCIVCNLSQLGENFQSLHDGYLCSFPYHSFGIKNGVACYDGIDVGSTATYTCVQNCYLSTQLVPPIRTCLSYGRWSGYTPKCKCEFLTP